MTVPSNETRTKPSSLLLEAVESAAADPAFLAALRERELSLLLVETAADAEPALAYVDAEGVRFDGPLPKPVLRLELDAETASKLLTGRLPLPQAAAARRLTIKGPVSRIRELAAVLPLLAQAYIRLATARA